MKRMKPTRASHAARRHTFAPISARFWSCSEGWIPFRRGNGIHQDDSDNLVGMPCSEKRHGKSTEGVTNQDERSSYGSAFEEQVQFIDHAIDATRIGA